MHPKLLVWGTYDLGKPRVRILLAGIRATGVGVTEIHGDVWSGIEDKSSVRGLVRWFRVAVNWILQYPVLIFRFLKVPKHQMVLIPYMGHLDVLFLWPFARLRGTKIIWDAFISLYNTVVEDRSLVSQSGPTAWAIHAFEWLATRGADCVMLDTQAHADYFEQRYRIPAEKLVTVFVGAEEGEFPQVAPLKPKGHTEPLVVLFYGQFIPLHGIGTIIQAARSLEDSGISWVLIGQGQEDDRIRSLLDADPVTNLQWIPWVAYEDLVGWIAKSDICLGVFSSSEKASRVIPNKVFQVLSAGRPLVTRDSPAIRELLDDRVEGVFLVPPENAQALAEAVTAFKMSRQRFEGKILYESIRPRISTAGIGAQFRAEIFECGLY